MISKLIEEIRKKNAPVVVGLDPQMSFIPEQLLKDAARHVEDATYDEDLGAAAEAVWRFNKEIVDAVADLVPAVKPQIAMYEQFGIPGMIAYWKTVRYCQEKGLIVIGDVKRGDIGSTSEAYARAHLGRVEIGGHRAPSPAPDRLLRQPLPHCCTRRPSTARPTHGPFRRPPRTYDGRPRS